MAVARRVAFVDVGDVVVLEDREAVEAARLRRLARSALLEQWPSVTYASLAEVRGTSEATVRQSVGRHHKAGRMIVVEADRSRVPTFQLDEVFDLRGDVASVVRILSARLDDWAMWRWMCAHNPWIDRCPVELIDQGPQGLATLRALATRLVAASE